MKPAKRDQSSFQNIQNHIILHVNLVLLPKSQFTIDVLSRRFSED